MLQNMNKTVNIYKKNIERYKKRKDICLKLGIKQQTYTKKI
jgi:hypothetical protein